MDQLLRTRLVTVVVLAVVFGSGVLLGLAADRSLEAEPASGAVRTQAEADPPRRVPMYEQVGPDSAQKVVIDSIVQEYRAAMKQLQREFRDAYNPRYEALVDETRSAIKGVLTPDQAAAYDSLFAQSQRRRAERDSSEDRE
jgi:Spy/CpxP family protein refolding chaperone